MKIGILTFHASHNYGSMLQAWALQTYLKRQGHDVETINLRIKIQREIYNFPLRPVRNKLKKYFKSLCNPVWLYHACRKWLVYENFMNKNLTLTEKVYSNWDEIRKDIPSLGYQCVITGGDQIWNMNCPDFSESYYLPSDLGNIKKISYSPSFGNFLQKITPLQEAFVKRHLASYSHISAREASMQKYLKEKINRETFVACDPTLLLHADDYNRFITEEPIIEENYIYYYSPLNNSKRERLAVLLGKHYGMKVITSFPHLRNNKMESVPEAGPAEFLNLVKNATMVVGKSFHLVVFAMLFHKDFIAIEGDNDARMRNILSLLNIRERGQVTEDNYKSIQLPPIDFATIDRLLDQERVNSYNFLNKALK